MGVYKRNEVVLKMGVSWMFICYEGLLFLVSVAI